MGRHTTTIEIDTNELVSAIAENLDIDTDDVIDRIASQKVDDVDVSDAIEKIVEQWFDNNDADDIKSGVLDALAEKLIDAHVDTGYIQAEAIRKLTEGTGVTPATFVKVLDIHGERLGAHDSKQQSHDERLAAHAEGIVKLEQLHDRSAQRIGTLEAAVTASAGVSVVDHDRFSELENVVRMNGERYEAADRRLHERIDTIAREIDAADDEDAKVFDKLVHDVAVLQGNVPIVRSAFDRIERLEKNLGAELSWRDTTLPREMATKNMVDFLAGKVSELHDEVSKLRAMVEPLAKLLAAVQGIVK